FVLGWIYGVNEVGEQGLEVASSEAYQSLVNKQSRLLAEAESEDCTLVRKAEIASQLKLINGELQRLASGFGETSVNAAFGGLTGYASLILVVGVAACAAL
ncbi:hypothetical protein C9975_10675, partial [Thalassospira xiamenensis]